MVVKARADKDPSTLGLRFYTVGAGSYISARTAQNCNNDEDLGKLHY